MAKGSIHSRARNRQQQRHEQNAQLPASHQDPVTATDANDSLGRVMHGLAWMSNPQETQEFIAGLLKA